MEADKTVPKISLGHRIPAVLTTLAVIMILALMPNRIKLFPRWFFYGIAAATLLPMLVVGIAPNKKFWLRIERIVMLGTCILCCVGNCITMVILIKAILYKSGSVTGLQLLSSSVALWINNVFVFTLAYWQIDRGGPEGRMSVSGGRPHWHFPQQEFAEEVAPGWKPEFIDYLFLGFSTATAFSMTEATPLTRRAKILMMIESSISLITIVVVGARSINILGN